MFLILICARIEYFASLLEDWILETLLVSIGLKLCNTFSMLLCKRLKFLSQLYMTPWAYFCFLSISAASIWIVNCWAFGFLWLSSRIMVCMHFHEKFKRKGSFKGPNFSRQTKIIQSTFSGLTFQNYACKSSMVTNQCFTDNHTSFFFLIWAISG